jgi:hypothetical protein
VHSLRIDHEFNYFNPYNTCDETGFTTMAFTLTQFFNQMQV